MTNEEIIALMTSAKALGIVAFKYKTLSFNYPFPLSSDQAVAAAEWTQAQINQPNSMNPEVKDSKPEELVKPMSVLDELTDKEILFYATPYFDEIQAEKEAHKQKLEEEKL